MEFKRTSDGRVFFSNLDDKSQQKSSHSNTNYSPEPALKSPLTGKILTPEQRERSRTRAIDQAPSQYQVLSLLKSLNEKLKLTQVERNTMRQELKAYRHMITSLEKKASESAKAQAELEHKIATQKSSSDLPSTVLNDIQETKNLYQKLENRAERNDRNVANLMEKAEAHKKVSIAMSKKQAELDRLSNQYIQLNGRVEQTEKNYQNINKALTTYSPQGQDQLLELIQQDRKDRARFMNKIERLEKTVLMLADSRETLQKLGGTSANAVPEKTKENDSPRYVVKNKNAQASQQKSSAQWVKELASQVNNPWQTLSEKKIPQIALGICLLLGASGIVINSNIAQRFETYFEQKQLNAVAEQIENIYTPPITHSDAPADTAATGEQSSVYQEPQSWDVSKDISQFMIKPDLPNPNLPTAAQQQKLNQLLEIDAAAVAETLNQIEPGTTAAPALTMPTDSVETQIPGEEVAVKQSTIGKADPTLPKSLQNLESLAMRGDYNAQHDLAALYVIGQNGVTQDYKRAAYWFDKAAQGGVANATYNMGVLYHQGLGIKQNTQQAVAWYKAAADQGHAEAAYNLGISHIEGIGVEYNPYKATLHFEKAALAGTVEAAYNLGLIYENGLLGAAKPGEALMWYKIAADNNLPEAQTAMNTLINSLGISYSELDQIISDVRQNYPAFQNTAPDTQNSSQTTGAVAPQQSRETVIDETLRQELLDSEKETQLIRMAQTKLMDLKLYPGPVDGSAGPNTQDAIRSYQQAYDLPVTGSVTADLIDHMQN